MIREYAYNLEPGASVAPNIQARYIGLKSCSVDEVKVKVQAIDADGGIEAEVHLQQGEKLPELATVARQVKIENTSATETINIVMVVGSSPFDSDRLSGAVSINDAVNIAELAGGRLAKLGEIEPMDLANCTEWNIDSTTAALQTIVTPAANVNGLKILRARGAYGSARLMYKATAPASWFDTDAKTLLLCQVLSSTGLDGDSAENLLIPPGMGLYYQANSSANPIRAFVQYEVL